MYIFVWIYIDDYKININEMTHLKNIFKVCIYITMFYI